MVTKSTDSRLLGKIFECETRIKKEHNIDFLDSNPLRVIKFDGVHITLLNNSLKLEGGIY